MGEVSRFERFPVVPRFFGLKVFASARERLAGDDVLQASLEIEERCL